MGFFGKHRSSEEQRHNILVYKDEMPPSTYQDLLEAAQESGLAVDDMGYGIRLSDLSDSQAEGIREGLQTQEINARCPSKRPPPRGY